MSINKNQRNSVSRLLKYSNKLIKKYKNKNNLAVVFDIDDTLIENMRIGNGEIITIPIQGMLDVYEKFAGQDNISIFLVTARPETYRGETLNMLEEVGITDFVHLYHRPLIYLKKRKLDPRECVCFYKETARMKIENDFNKTIILNVGDQLTDHQGGYFIEGWKMPARYTHDCMHTNPVEYPGIVR